MFASAVMDEAASLLNDQAKATFNYTNMLPYLSKANDELEKQLVLNGISVVKQLSSSSTIAVGTVVFPLPVDMIVPQSLWERQSGSQDVFIKMDEKDIPPEELASSNLKYWSFKNLTLFIGPANSAGATTARQVKLNYLKALTPLTASGSVVDITISKTYLAERTAGLAARFIGENPERADVLDVSARGPQLDGKGGSLGELTQVFIRNNQSYGVRRKAFTRSRLGVR